MEFVERESQGYHNISEYKKKLFKNLGNIKKTTVIAAQLEGVHEIKKETRKLREKACMVNDQNHSSYKRLEDFLYKGDSLSKCEKYERMQSND